MGWCCLLSGLIFTGLLFCLIVVCDAVQPPGKLIVVSHLLVDVIRFLDFSWLWLWSSVIFSARFFYCYLHQTIPLAFLFCTHFSSDKIVVGLKTTIVMLSEERVVNAIIISQFDYCNSLLYGTSVNNIARLQRMHNSADRLILRRTRSDSAMPPLCFLPWMPAP